MQIQHAVLATILSTLSLASSPAHAHLMPRGQGTLNVQDGKAYMVLSIPVDAFSRVPACHDGILTEAELRDHGTTIRQQVREELQLTDTGTVPFSQILLDLPSGYGHAHDAGEDLVVMVVAPLPSPDAPLSLSSGLWTAEQPRLKVRATRSRDGRELRASVATLTTDDPTADFFAARPLRQTR